MRKGKEAPSDERPWQNLVLIELEWGFAFFDVFNETLDMEPNMIWAHFTNQIPAQEAVFYLDLVKFNDKNAVWSGNDRVWRTDGPAPKYPFSVNGDDESFAYWIKEYSRGAQRFVVVDENLRQLIRSKLSIDCFNMEEDEEYAYAIREVVWGIKYALPFLLNELTEKITFSRQVPRPLCQGLEDLMKKYEIMIPTEAVDRDFVATAGSLQRIEQLWLCRCIGMRKACDKLVPGISRMINDNSHYVEVMAKILIPSLVESDPHKWSTAADEPWFTPDELQKILAKDAAADDARKKVEEDYALADMIKNNLRDYRRYPKFKNTYIGKLRSYAAKAEAKRGKKRSHTEAAAEGRKEGMVYI